MRTWADGLKDALASLKGTAGARMPAERYADAFGAAYREAFSAAESVKDIGTLETLSADKPRAVDFYRREGDPASRINLKVFTRGRPMPLSQRVPMLENMGFTVVNERTYRIVPAGSGEAERVWLHDMALERRDGRATLRVEGADTSAPAGTVRLSPRVRAAAGVHAHPHTTPLSRPTLVLVRRAHEHRHKGVGERGPPYGGGERLGRDACLVGQEQLRELVVHLFGVVGG